jgi:predicted dehydrogenase
MAKRKTASAQPIRVGVIGVGRGQTFMRQAPYAGMQLVAICDTWQERLHKVGQELNVATYTDYDQFLQHDMDAVITANYFHQHAPFAIQALRAGKHVMSETSACKTLAEGVALIREVEKSGRIYMFAENYPYTAANLEMRRLYQAGEIGHALYADGEYNHPMALDDVLRISPGLQHWRNNLPSTYYCTHALAPLMSATDTWPVSVNALSIAAPEGFNPLSPRRGDIGAVILCRMDNGAVFKLLQTGVPGHSIWYRIHGTHGLMEHTRGPGYWGPGQLRVAHDPWDLRRNPGEVTERTFLPDFPDWAREAGSSGHGGGDYFTTHYFGEAIRSGRPPYLDVYRGVAMSIVGILAWKSALLDGASMAVPDFRDEQQRLAYAEDHWSPFPEDAGPGQPYPSIRGDIKPKPAAVRHARKVWKEIGYTD